MGGGGGGGVGGRWGWGGGLKPKILSSLLFQNPIISSIGKVERIFDEKAGGFIIIL